MYFQKILFILNVVNLFLSIEDHSELKWYSLCIKKNTNPYVRVKGHSWFITWKVENKVSIDINKLVKLSNVL